MKALLNYDGHLTKVVYDRYIIKDGKTTHYIVYTDGKRKKGGIIYTSKEFEELMGKGL